MEEKPQDHFGTILARKDGYDIVACEPCGFVHCTPIPEAETLESEYAEAYYTTIKPDYIKLVEQDRPWYENTYTARLTELEKYTQGRRLLEVGSGPGLFLQCARGRGWEVCGFEPSREAWSYSTQVLGLPVHNFCFNAGVCSAVSAFDAAYLGLVLEHIPNPEQLLRQVRSCLNPGAGLCVAVPNDFSPLQNFLHKQREFAQWWVSPPHHINYFSHQSLAGLLEKCGFSIKRVSSTFPIDLSLLLGFDYIANPQLGRECHGLRMRFEEEFAHADLQALQNDIYDVLAKHDLGREVVIYAKNGE